MDSSPSSDCSSSSTDLVGLLESTVTLSRGLETLYSEHEVLLDALGYSSCSEQTSTTTLQSSLDREEVETEDFGLLVKTEKTDALSHSLSRLKTGLSEAKLLHMMAQYVNTLEGDKRTLRAQVKRLASENNWLRKELGNHQQLLQETEIQLVKVKEEKEQLEFTLSHKKEGQEARELSPSMDIDIQEEEAEGVHSSRSSGSIGASTSRSEYEVPENIKTLHQLALQYVNQGKPEIAVPFCKKAILGLKQKKGPDDPDVAAMLNILAVIYREQGKMKESIKCLHETLDIRERQFGMDHPAVAATYNNLSVLHGKIGDFKTAEPFCKKALEIRQKLLGATHPDVAKQFSNLAILCQNLGKYDEVEYYYQRALEIYQTELGPDDPNIAKTLNHLANCYLKQGKYRAAEATYKKVLDTVETREGSGVGGVSCQSPTQSTAWVLSTSPSERDASTTTKRSDTNVCMTPGTPGGGGGGPGPGGGWLRSTPVHSPTVNSTLRNLSNVYREQGQLGKAEELETFTKQKSLDRAQQDRVFELLSEAEGAADTSLSYSSSAPNPTRSQQAFRAKRPSLSQSVRRLFRFRVEPDDTLPESSSQ